jgi:predicted secreted protein
MKFKITLISAILAILLLIPSCLVTSRDINVDISCDEFSANNHVRNDFQAEIGDKIRVKLCSNPTTGFKWEYSMSVENVLQEEDYDYEEPADKNLVGADGKEVWTFEAASKGTTEVRMEYRRPWEGGEKAEWTYTMNITVK